MTCKKVSKVVCNAVFVAIVTVSCSTQPKGVIYEKYENLYADEDARGS